jgi:hypothetical protein
MTDIEIEILIGIDPAEQGEKSIFDGAARSLSSIRTTASAVTKNLAAFSECFSAGISSATAAIANYELSTVELIIELNAKGEVRLIAAGSSEVKSGIKLVFTRKAQNTQ